MCCAVAIGIVINKLSHLSDRVCNSCWRRKVQNLFHLVKNSTKEESVQSPDRFVSNGNLIPPSVSLSQRSLVNRKVFRIGLQSLHATAYQHQPKDNFLEEVRTHNVSTEVCLKLMKLK